MKRNELPSYRHALRMHWKGVRVLAKLCPRLLTLIILSNIVHGAFPYITIWCSARIINELAGACQAEELWKWVIITLAVEVLIGILKALFANWEVVETDYFHIMRRRLYVSKLMTMDYADIDKQETSDLYAQIMQNESNFGWGLYCAARYSEDFVNGSARIIGTVMLSVSLFTMPVPESAEALTWLNNPLFALVVLGAMMLNMGYRVHTGTLIDKNWVTVEKLNRLGNRIAVYFGMKVTKSHRALDMRMYEQQRISEHYHEENIKIQGMRGPHTRWMDRKGNVLLATASGLNALFTGLVYAFACLKAWAGAFGVGSVTQYIGAFLGLREGVEDLFGCISAMRTNAIHLEDTLGFMNIPNSMYQGSLTTEKRADRQYDVEFRDVSFKYPGSEIWVLRHVNMKFKVGKRLAIVGENGSGKTTFIKLLCRLYDPQEGQILLNGIDIRKYNYRDYMDVFAVVFQDFQLIAQSLGSNVAGSAVYDEEKARKALIDAGFGERLETLPDGLNTQLFKEFGEDGVEVSGGEAQKIAIARALYKDAPFIILDEPTASLDPMAEAEIYSKFNDISGDKTAIYISHRLSSCIFCDEIAVFHDGAVIQQGTHQELLADTDGKYHALWHAQAQYYTEEKP